MPVSHIGLTVSHLPTSCSFFLAALTPLGYRYIGQQGNQIGFGIENAEFYICQETERYLNPSKFMICLSKNSACSVQASAAHIAFAAPSRSVVDACFYAALKAGGRIHGEPAIRDQETGYYSAAVLDFDDNSIEIMYREKKTEASGTPSGVSEEHRVLKWQKAVAKSTVESDTKSEKSAARIIINNITTPTRKVSYSQPEPSSSGEMSAKALVGMLLGAAAGAAVAYAMTKAEEESQKVSASGQVLYQAIEAVRPSIARSATEPGGLFVPSHTRPRELEYPRSAVSHASRGVQSHTSSSNQRTGPLAIGSPLKLSTLIDTFVPPSEVERVRPHSLARRRTDGVRIFDEVPQPSDPRSRVSTAKTIKQTNFQQRQPPSVVTEIRTARGVPLPESRASSTTSSRAPSLRRLVLDAGHDDTRSILESVSPNDSVSQAGSKRSKESRRSSRRSSRHRSEMSRERRKHKDDDGNSHASEKTVRAAGSSVEKKKGSAVSLPIRPASKASVHRSVRSFIPGM